MKRAFMSMVTAILLIGAVFINNASAASSEDNFDLNNITNYEKVEKLTTEYADAYITGKDQITYIVDSKKIHYKDENGSWRDIDNEIIQQKDISNKYSFKNKANDFLTSFGVNEGQPIAKIEKGKYSIEFVLLSDKSAVLSQDQSVEDQNNEYLKQINDQNNSLIYKNVFPNADMAYSVDGEELKEDIILYSKPSFTELVYTINVNNLGFRKETHEYAGYNEDTKEEKNIKKKLVSFMTSKLMTKYLNWITSICMILMVKLVMIWNGDIRK